MNVLTRDRAHPVQLTLNGLPRRATTEPRQLLSDFLRQELGLTGTHVGCEHGVCGACTVRVDGVAQRACLMLAVQVDGCAVQTIEGLAAETGGGNGSGGDSDTLGDLQAAFKRHHALQCGFCSAGILMSAADWLQRVPQPSEAQVREMLSGHLCRCTGYTPIVAAILDVAQARAAARATKAGHV
ncbi:MAG: (2Fe-2S)-binding protein [Burkholderiaceae bacterium]|jgi:2-furoyl-CoA dehydrogenase 2Fe-2S iron sulfur subunit|nr:(2Fe-2S)-binding protein [Burkholderiaceae bacterium]